MTALTLHFPLKGLLLALLLLPKLLGAEPADLDKLLSQLGHEDFEKREEASRKIKALFADQARREASLLRIRQLWQNQESPEIKARLFTLGRDLFARSEGALFGFRFMKDRPLKVGGKTTSSIIISEVLPDMPAAKAGLRANDLIYGANDDLLGPGQSTEEIMTFFKFLNPEKGHRLLVRRDGKDLVLKIKPVTQELTEPEKEAIRKGYLRWLSSNDPPPGFELMPQLPLAK